MTPDEARRKERYGLVTVIVELREELDAAKAEGWDEGYRAATSDELNYTRSRTANPHRKETR